MIEATASVNLRGFPRGTTAIVDETDPRVKGYIRAGLIVPLSDASPQEPEPEQSDE